MLPTYSYIGYAGENNFAQVDGLAMGRYLLTKVWVWPSCRRQGIGNYLLQRVLWDADKEGVELRLTVSGWGTYPRLNDSELVGWYRRWGFLHKTTWDMVREPNPFYWQHPEPTLPAPNFLQSLHQ